MKNALSGYLEVLFEQNPKSVGGTLPVTISITHPNGARTQSRFLNE
ncbi:MAG: hypothetical protein ACLT98_08880 [Eggerthellaceae bacterium]